LSYSATRHRRIVRRFARVRAEACLPLLKLFLMSCTSSLTCRRISRICSTFSALYAHQLRLLPSQPVPDTLHRTHRFPRQFFLASSLVARGRWHAQLPLRPCARTLNALDLYISKAHTFTYRGVICLFLILRGHLCRPGFYPAAVTLAQGAT
jgi:hypothetical protein